MKNVLTGLLILIGGLALAGCNQSKGPAKPIERERDLPPPPPFPEIDPSTDGSHGGGNGQGGQGGQPGACAQRPSTPPGFIDQVLGLTNGDCDLRNPHSLGCVQWNFRGNPIFPQIPIDWSHLRGTWTAVTWVNFQDSFDGLNLWMMVNPERPSQPMGVFNDSAFRSPVGNLEIFRNGMEIANWKGGTLIGDIDSFFMPNDFKFKIELYDDFKHEFECIDFNRNGNDHLLCLWSKYEDDGRKYRQGYIGFLRKSVWDQFIQCAR